MKLCPAVLALVVMGTLFTGCATSGNEISQKDRARMERERERADRKQAQEQAKMMRDPTRDRNSGFRR